MAEMRKVAIVGSARIPFTRAYTGYANESNLTMLGAALVTTIRSGLLVLQIGNFWLQLFLGLILLLAVFADRYRSVYQLRRSAGRA